MSISPATKLTAIIGDPVTHSLSPLLHNALYAKEGVDAVMLAFGNPSIEPLVAAIRALPVHLAAVTMPHKQTIMPLLDEIDEVARDIGAVNTVVNREGRLHGYNTDVVGIAEALKGVSLRGSRALLVGAGGAARTAAYLLKREGASIYCTNRDRAQADDLLGVFGGSFLETNALDSISFNTIINATPIGMKPNVDAMPIPEEFIREGSAVFDLVYSPLETKLLASAKARGARAISGLSMFLAQGLEQERLWLEKTFDESYYRGVLEKAVRER
ncbi:shikimate dehydrogenase [Candidatus Kaiserbacteria bacterium RIFCSPHIGHO2_01_FULL_55_17]|uniref:Shikimate dehydrogenase (NADP(+)) n=1 Tax=Candidatus Kaiserbacteria bacterium RIFCSPHIGHO2_01_FULL_55_17 TaxID=1798484 RepID=A0A1F6D890_9BACT|nr:MAG: shikimate dehydrogenase [Candidatus Kaiserbacteria bacterium RIFCSPHIGHO2_01_FULL_55_17]